MKKILIVSYFMVALIILVLVLGSASPAHAQWAAGFYPWYYVNADPVCGTGSAGALIIRKDLPGLRFCNDSLVVTPFPGGSSAPSLDTQYRGICQNTVASFGVSWGTDGSVAAGCPSLTNILYSGQLSFADSGTPVVFGSLELPATLPSSITFTAGIASGSASQVYKTRLYTACVSSAGASQDPSFNSAQTLNFTSSGSAGNETVQTISAITLTGCMGGYRLIWKLDRDTTDTSTVALLFNYFRFVGN